MAFQGAFPSGRCHADVRGSRAVRGLRVRSDPDRRPVPIHWSRGRGRRSSRARRSTDPIGRATSGRKRSGTWWWRASRSWRPVWGRERRRARRKPPPWTARMPHTTPRVRTVRCGADRPSRVYHPPPQLAEARYEICNMHHGCTTAQSVDPCRCVLGHEILLRVTSATPPAINTAPKASPSGGASPRRNTATGTPTTAPTEPRRLR